MESGASATKLLLNGTVMPAPHLQKQKSRAAGRQ
jgi:hypothetical protein